MARRRTIIGIGEAMLAEYPDRTEPAGLALDVARLASKLGHHGIPISRLGQDALANELLTQLEALKVDRTHIQSDPDLPTGRLVIRSIAGQQKESLDHRAAFDNLQWDFDLVDVAHQADAVVFGTVAQRGGQSSSVIQRFLSECSGGGVGAIIACDLTNRADETFDRGQAVKSLELAHIAVVDETAASILRIRAASETPREDVSRALMREYELAAVVWLDPNEPMEVHSSEGTYATERQIERIVHPAAIVGLLHAMLRGDDTQQSTAAAERIAAHVRENPDDETVPEAIASGGK